MYTYSAKLIRVIDGDTVDLEIDLGFDISIRQRLKLYGVDTPDSRSVNSDTKQKGLEAKQRLTELLPRQFKITTILNKRGKYGRVLGTIFLTEKDSGNEVNVNELMVTEGHAIKYTIQGK
jgi:micrococcal nuclease